MSENLFDNKLDACLNRLLESGVLTEMEEKIFRLRYGLDGVVRANFEELVKVLNRNPKLLKKEILDLDRKVFNYAKSRVE